MENTKVGRLCGAEEMVLERVVTYLVSAAELGIRFVNMRLLSTEAK